MTPNFISMSMLFAGGGLGTLLRFAVVRWITPVGPHAFPWGTLAANITGCFAIGLLAHTLFSAWALREEWRIAIIVGILGGFTTFSSFGLECVQIWNAGHHARACAYLLTSNVGAIAAVALGLFTASMFIANAPSGEMP